jgi:hypothetical protein
MAVRSTALTLYGSPITGLSFFSGETELWQVTCQDPATRVALNLVGSTLLLRFWTFDIQGNRDVLLTQYPATPIAPSSGLTSFLFLPPIASGTFGLDVLLTDSQGNHLFLLPLVEVTVAGGPSLSQILIPPNFVPVPGPPGAMGVPGPSFTNSGFVAFSSSGSNSATVALDVPQASSNYRVWLSPRVDDDAGFIAFYYKIVDVSHFLVVASSPFNGGFTWGTLP